MSETRMITSSASRTGPEFAPGMLPSHLGWGSDEAIHPDRFAINEPDGAEMVWVPPGLFSMGTLAGEIYDILFDDKLDVPPWAHWLSEDERPCHGVRITEGFWLYKHPVTFAQCMRILGDDGPRPRSGWRVMLGTGDPEVDSPYGPHYGGDHPITHAAWADAAAYAEKAGVVLPTEAQWEYAARGRQHLKYPWGNETDPSRCKCYCPEIEHEFERTSPVGSFPAGASWCGALDMSGNVREWCKDWYVPYSYESDSTPLIDPEGTDPSSGRRVMRGGSWMTAPLLVRCAVRFRVRPDHAFLDVGFRCLAR